MGLLGELMRNAPTLRQALLDYASQHHRQSHGGVLYLLEDKKGNGVSLTRLHQNTL